MRSTPWVAGCCGPMFRLMSCVASSPSPRTSTSIDSPGGPGRTFAPGFGSIVSVMSQTYRS